MLKIEKDTSYIKSCKREELILTFAKVNLLVKCGDYKVKNKTARLVISILGNTIKEIRSANVPLTSYISVIYFNRVNYEIEKAIGSQQTLVNKGHERKLHKFINKMEYK